MRAVEPAALRPAVTSLLTALLCLSASGASAFPGTLSNWQSRYGAISPSGDNAGCQLCHANANGGSPWNGYGWDLRLALDDLSCDLDASGDVSHEEAFYCVESLNSDGDGSGIDNLAEIGVGAQPGWVAGPFNVLYSDLGQVPGQLPPANIGLLDPTGTEPPPPVEPPPPGSEEPLGRPRWLQVVRPGQSIQRAVDRAKHGGVVFVLPGTYREIGDPTNGLQISKSVHLIGLSTKRKRVVLANAGNQRNGIVVVPEDRQECMSCHSSMAPPFELRPGVDPGTKTSEPMIHGLEIRGIDIANFSNNGLFTEHVDGFSIVDVASIGNKNYGIFPTLSRNGVVRHSRATGADDSGIWVETSQNVRVSHNLVEGNTNGFEVSNSDDIELHHNVARHNTVGFAILLLPDIFDERAGAKRIDVHDNTILENNKPNTARPGSILSMVPSGIGILHLGVDESEISGNLVKGNGFVGIGLSDYCLPVLGTAFDCSVDPTVTPEFLADQATTNNRVVGNTLSDNGTNPGAGNPFAFAASDLTLLTFQDGGNCYADNVFSTFYSLLGLLPPCP